MNIILASTSLSRKKILEKFLMPFECIAPDCDETPLANESALELVLRLSQIKAQSVALRYPHHLVIGSDQVGVLDGQIIGKPHTIDKAIEQLHQSSGRTVNFYTGLCVIHEHTQQITTICEPFKVKFRTLSSAEIESYVLKELPLHCAGSFKCDELGITLFDELEGDDINTLVGLPLIKLNKIMINMGFNPLLLS